MTKEADLIAYLFEERPNQLSTVLRQWMEASPRFTLFVETYRDKIRKKIRLNREAARMLDLRSELDAAYCLLNDRRLALTYEPYASEKRRGADFAVTYRANLVFNIEVARIHVENGPVGGNGLGEAVDLSRAEVRILRTLLDKLGQMQAGMANLLVIHTPEELRLSIELGLLMQGLKTRVEKKDPAFHAFSGYPSPADFYKDFHRLNGILLWAAEVQPWANKQARTGLNEKVLHLVGSLLSRAPPS
jgi:hypothetical protein